MKKEAIHLVPTRRPRFTKALRPSGVNVKIPPTWSELPTVPREAHDPMFLRILKKHGVPADSPIPLVGRYSKPRPWSAEELDACVAAHNRSVPVALMSAALNRNPQDIIYRLLDAFHQSGDSFREVGLESSGRWSATVEATARELFDAGLTAWRIAALFGVDFEGVEKAMYAGRSDYGHAKRNPFAICTDHKQEVNRSVLRELTHAHRVLDAFAGEGRFTAIVEELFPSAAIQCVELDAETFGRAQTARSWREHTRWLRDNNIDVMKSLARETTRFDVVDLDPFVSCREQVDLVWPLLADRAALFVTFGGEYRRSFIQTNRKAIARRYGFLDTTLSNSEYLEVVPAYFFGWLASEAAKNRFVLELTRAVRYPNNCRFWMSARRSSALSCTSWLDEHTRRDANGTLWEALSIPRFSELRREAQRATRTATREAKKHTCTPQPATPKEGALDTQIAFGFANG